MSLLRRRLGSAPGDGRGLLVTEPGGYRLAAEALQVDVDRFDALVRRAAAAPAERRALLEAAVELAGGELLADEPYVQWMLGPARTTAPARPRR